MYCPNCGTELDNGSSFCHICGSKIEEVNEESGLTSESTRYVEDDIDFGNVQSQSSFDNGFDKLSLTSETSTPIYGNGKSNSEFEMGGGQQGMAYLADNTASSQVTPQTGTTKTVIAVAAIAFVAILVVAIVAFLMLGSEADAELYNVRYETNGGTAIAATQAEEGSQVTSPANPTKNGYQFDGWYFDSEHTQAVTFPLTIEDEDIVLYAKWEENDQDDNSTTSTSADTEPSTSVATPITPTESSSTPAAVEPEPPTSAKTPTSSGYVITSSSSTYLSRDYLESFSSDDLEIAMNEIWARHGRLFNNNWLQSYFNSQTWYSGTIPADEFLNRYEPTEIEDANSQLMADILNERGYSVNKAHPN